MHYFKRNIGDYHKRAGKLSMLEHGAYTLLIDSCYDRERFPTFDEAIDWTWARTNEEIAAVKFVLSKFFILSDGVYKQHSIQEEINAYHNKSIINRQIAINREETKRTNRERNVNETCTNEHLTKEPKNQRTRNQEPVKKHSADRACIFPEEISEQLQNDFIALRKAKKSPLTKTALAGIERESVKAGISLQAALETCCQRGWTGFKAEWMAKENAQFRQQSIHEKRAETIAILTGRSRKNGNDNEFDITGESQRVI